MCHQNGAKQFFHFNIDFGIGFFISSKWGPKSLYKTKFPRRHLDDIKKYVPEFVPEFIPEFLPDFDLNADFSPGTNSGMNSGTNFFYVV